MNDQISMIENPYKFKSQQQQGYESIRLYYSLLNEIENKDRLIGDMDLAFLPGKDSAISAGFLRSTFGHWMKDPVSKVLTHMGHEDHQVDDRFDGVSHYVPEA